MGWMPSYLLIHSRSLNIIDKRMSSTAGQDLARQLESIHSEIEAIDQCTSGRQKKYDNAMKWYLNHIKKQSKLFEENIKHSNQRNIMFMEDIQKSEQRAFRNAPMVMKIIKETNREKRAVNKLIANTLANFKENSGEQANLHQSVDLSKYKDILEQYRHKIH